jgi:hypothetical protein
MAESYGGCFGTTELFRKSRQGAADYSPRVLGSNQTDLLHRAPGPGWPRRPVSSAGAATLPVRVLRWNCTALPRLRLLGGAAASAPRAHRVG